MRRIGSLIKEIHCQTIISDCRQCVNLYQTNQSDANGQRTTDTRLRIFQRVGDFVVLIRKCTDVINVRCESLHNQEMLRKDR